MRTIAPQTTRAKANIAAEALATFRSTKRGVICRCMNKGGFSARRADFLCSSVKCSNVQSLTLTKPASRRASLTLPGDKSISHRAFMLSAIARGQTRIVNPNSGDDVSATIRALRQLGVEVRRVGDDYVVVGRDTLRDPRSTIDCG